MMRQVRFSRFGVVLAMAAAAVVNTRADAFIIPTATGTENTTEGSVNAFDATFPYYRNAGRIYNASPFVFASGVYLGGGWVMTAEHVGPYDIEVINSGGSPQTLTAIPGTDVEIDDDLIMYQVSGDPGLPTLPIRSTPLVAGQQVIAIGNGLDRDPNDWFWRVDTGPNPDVWDAPSTTSQTLVAPWDVEVTGHRTSVSLTQSKRWGSNLVDDDDFTLVGLPNGWLTIFDDPNSAIPTGFLGTTYENQGAFGDSGGPAFVKNGLGQWELAGITHSVLGFGGQPSAANNQVFGNATYYSDLYDYRSTILATIPEPASVSLLLAGAALVLRRSRRGA